MSLSIGVSGEKSLSFVHILHPHSVSVLFFVEEGFGCVVVLKCTLDVPRELILGREHDVFLVPSAATVLSVVELVILGERIVELGRLLLSFV